MDDGGGVATMWAAMMAIKNLGEVSPIGFAHHNT